MRVDRPMAGLPRLVAGVDVAYESDSARAGRIAGAVVVLDLADLSVVASATAAGLSDFPYIPGLLAFREIPILLTALDRLTVQPDLLVCDGYGIAHPRRCGLAQARGNGVAGGPDDRRSGADQQDRAGNVPRVGQHQDGAGVMSGAETESQLGWLAHGYELMSGSIVSSMTLGSNARTVCGSFAGR